MNNDSLIGKLEALICNPYCKADDAHNNAVKQCVTIIRQHTAAPDVGRVAEAIGKSIALQTNAVVTPDGYRTSNEQNIYCIPIAEAAIAVMGSERGAPSTEGGRVQLPADPALSSEMLDNAIIERMCLAAWGAEGKYDKTLQISIMEDVLDAIRPYLATRKPVSTSKIRVLNDAGAVKVMLAACEGLEDLEDCMRAAYHALDNEEYLRTTKPVSVSLEKTAKKLAGEEADDVTGEWRAWHTYQETVRTVLDAAGVAYE